MTIDEFVEVKELPAVRDYKIAEEEIGFVVPGRDFLASISPDEPVNYLALLRFKQGEARANHYHRKKIEHLVVLDGSLKVTLFLPDEAGNRKEIEISGGSVLTIQPGCAHIVTAITESAAALELSPQKLDLSDNYPISS